MRGSQDGAAERLRERYLVYRDGELMARVASVVGLTTVLASNTSDEDRAVSFAGVISGREWLRGWADAGVPGLIEILEKKRQMLVRLHVRRLVDPLLSGETYEALVDKAVRLA